MFFFRLPFLSSICSSSGQFTSRVDQNMFHEAGLSDRLNDKNARKKFRFLSTRQSLLHGKKNLTEFLKYRKRRFGVTLSYTYIGTESTEECVAYQLSTPQSSSSLDNDFPSSISMLSHMRALKKSLGTSFIVSLAVTTTKSCHHLVDRWSDGL